MRVKVLVIEELAVRVSPSVLLGLCALRDGRQVEARPGENINQPS